LSSKLLSRIKCELLASEVLRHIAILETGQAVPQETRGFNEDSGETFKLRSKENAPDYRYMPDPNIPPLLIDTVSRKALSYTETYTIFCRHILRAYDQHYQSSRNKQELAYSVLGSMNATWAFC
jgi:Asp-tRNA(Asn)/Glu-tRNA(Gln) amidotransferase B subunit